MGLKARSLILPRCNFIVKKSFVMFTPVSTTDLQLPERLTRYGPSPRPIWERAAEKIRVNRKGWWWTGTIGNDGYGKITLGSRIDGPRSPFQAHRVVWTLLNGPVPTDMDLDHLCRDRDCVWPEHLEIVTRRENLLRGKGVTAKKAAQTHCVRGHLFDEANTIIHKNGTRHCRACANENRKKYGRYPK